MSVWLAVCPPDCMAVRLTSWLAVCLYVYSDFICGCVCFCWRTGGLNVKRKNEQSDFGPAPSWWAAAGRKNFAASGPIALWKRRQADNYPRINYHVAPWSVSLKSFSAPPLFMAYRYHVLPASWIRNRKFQVTSRRSSKWQLASSAAARTKKTQAHMGHAWAGHGYALREKKWGESIDNPEF